MWCWQLYVPRVTCSRSEIAPRWMHSPVLDMSCHGAAPRLRLRLLHMYLAPEEALRVKYLPLAPVPEEIQETSRPGAKTPMSAP